MSLVPRPLFPTLNRWTAGALLAACAAASAAVFWSAHRRLPAVEPHAAPSVPVPAETARPERPVSIPLEGWAAFRMDGEAVKQVSVDLAARYRLAGTFRVVQPEETIQKAVLTDLSQKDLSLIVAPGDKLDDGVVVRSIESDRLELVRQDVVCVLTLDFSATNTAAAANFAATAGSNDVFQGYPVLSRNRFGIQVDEGHWLVERRKVLEYYNAVLEDADRLVALFDSLKPLYNEKKAINGYILIPEGEQEFFTEVGLKEGDVIRKVNSMPLMNRRVAEGFIRDFGNNELSAAVLEIERAGEPVRLVYEVR